jgi:prolyl 4-hydroxylase
MAVQPKVGDAILFFSFQKGGGSDAASMHASCPTLGGTKWTATKWIHEKKFATGVWKKPRCEDDNNECANWARGGVRWSTH